WQLGLIYNLFQGSPVDITAAPTSFGLEYGNGLPDVRHPVDFNKISKVRWGIQNGNFLEGPYLDKGDVFTFVPDPQCGPVTALTATGVAQPGSYRFDANFGKTFKVSENRTLVVRFDALNVLNHPVPQRNGGSPNPSLNLDSTTAPFGQFPA